jgi:hypothetical protein
MEKYQVSPLNGKMSSITFNAIHYNGSHQDQEQTKISMTPFPEFICHTWIFCSFLFYLKNMEQNISQKEMQFETFLNSLPKCFRN